MRDQSPTGATHSSNASSASPEASPSALAHAHEDHYGYAHSETGEFNSMSTGRVSPGMQRPYSFAPPPVDFTSYNPGIVSLPHHPPPPRLLEPDRMGMPSHSPGSPFGRRSISPNVSNPKKRTLAETASSAEALAVPTTLESGSNQLPPIMSSSNPSPPGRLSSISSLLNHADTREEHRLDPSLVNAGRQHHQGPPASYPQSLPSMTELEGMQPDRRTQLQREAEHMREALRAKERELAELGRI